MLRLIHGVGPSDGDRLPSGTRGRTPTGQPMIGEPKDPGAVEPAQRNRPPQSEPGRVRVLPQHGTGGKFSGRTKIPDPVERQQGHLRSLRNAGKESEQLSQIRRAAKINSQLELERRASDARRAAAQADLNQRRVNETVFPGGVTRDRRRIDPPNPGMLHRIKELINLARNPSAKAFGTVSVFSTFERLTFHPRGPAALGDPLNPNAGPGGFFSLPAIEQVRDRVELAQSRMIRVEEATDP